jgi:hypothetical protein
MCWLLLGAYMAWVEAVYGKLGKSASIPDSGGADPLKSVSEKQTSAPPDWNVTLPEIPEMYRAEPAVLEAERVVRVGTPLTVKNIKDALRRSRR